MVMILNADQEYDVKATYTAICNLLIVHPDNEDEPPSFVEKLAYKAFVKVLRNTGADLESQFEIRHDQMVDSWRSLPGEVNTPSREQVLQRLVETNFKFNAPVQKVTKAGKQVQTSILTHYGRVTGTGRNGANPIIVNQVQLDEENEEEDSEVDDLSVALANQILMNRQHRGGYGNYGGSYGGGNYGRSTQPRLAFEKGVDKHGKPCCKLCGTTDFDWHRNSFQPDSCAFFYVNGTPPNASYSVRRDVFRHMDEAEKNRFLAECSAEGAMKGQEQTVVLAANYWESNKTPYPIPNVKCEDYR
jgi:hypothetical protein